MRYGRYGWSHLLLSWGLGATFLWIGIDMFRHPDVWIGYLPQNIPGGMSRDTALQFAALFDSALGVALIMRWWQKWTALLATLHLAGIIIQHGIDAVIIRDVGLLGAALALLKWPTHYRKKRWWHKLLGKSKSSSDDDE